MGKIFVFTFILIQCVHANASVPFPAGIWEGYKQMGSTYQEFTLEVDSDGNGFYGSLHDIKNREPVCFKISKASMLNLWGFFKQDDKLNGLEFSLILAPSIDNTFEATSILYYAEKKSTFSQSWTLTPVPKNNRNTRLVELCKGFLKKNT